MATPVSGANLIAALGRPLNEPAVAPPPQPAAEPAAAAAPQPAVAPLPQPAASTKPASAPQSAPVKHVADAGDRLGLKFKLARINLLIIDPQADPKLKVKDVLIAYLKKVGTEANLLEAFAKALNQAPSPEVVRKQWAALFPKEESLLALIPANKVRTALALFFKSFPELLEEPVKTILDEGFKNIVQPLVIFFYTSGRFEERGGAVTVREAFCHEFFNFIYTFFEKIDYKAMNKAMNSQQHEESALVIFLWLKIKCGYSPSLREWGLLNTLQSETMPELPKRLLYYSVFFTIAEENHLLDRPLSELRGLVDPSVELVLGNRPSLYHAKFIDRKPSLSTMHATALIHLVGFFAACENDMMLTFKRDSAKTLSTGLVKTVKTVLSHQKSEDFAGQTLQEIERRGVLFSGLVKDRKELVKVIVKKADLLCNRIRKESVESNLQLIYAEFLSTQIWNYRHLNHYQKLFFSHNPQLISTRNAIWDALIPLSHESDTETRKQREANSAYRWLCDLEDFSARTGESDSSSLKSVDEKKKPKAKNAAPAKDAKKAASALVVALDKPAAAPRVEDRVKERLVKFAAALGPQTRFADELSDCVLACVGACHFEGSMGQHYRVQEIKDHLFLATQGIEMLSQALLEGRSDALPLCLQAYLIDSHLALEQWLKLKTPSLSHSLTALAGPAATYSPATMRFFQEHDLALIWARYPEHGLAVNRQRPLSLQWIEMISGEGVPKKETLVRFAKEVIAHFQTCLRLILNNPPAELMDSLEKVRVFLGASLGTASSAKVAAGKEETALTTVRNSLVAVLSRPLAAAHFVDGDPILPLKEALHSLRWVASAYQLQARYPQESYKYWHMRNLMNFDKVFEQLYRTTLLVAGYGSLPTQHDFADTHSVLEEISDLRGFDFAAVRALNVGITHHYLHVQESTWSATFRNLIAYSKVAAQSKEGFQFVSASGSAGQGKDPTPLLMKQLQQALPSLEMLVKFVVGRLASA